MNSEKGKFCGPKLKFTRECPNTQKINNWIRGEAQMTGLTNLKLPL